MNKETTESKKQTNATPQQHEPAYPKHTDQAQKSEQKNTGKTKLEEKNTKFTSGRNLLPPHQQEAPLSAAKTPRTKQQPCPTTTNRDFTPHLMQV